MVTLPVDSIEYKIISDAEAVIEWCDDSVATVLPRNSVAFRGSLFRVAHLNTDAVSESTNLFLIPYSIHAIFRAGESCIGESHSLAFEFGSELESIGRLAFFGFSIPSIYIPCSVHFISTFAFEEVHSVACINFDRNSSLIRLKKCIFSPL
jgi:hypothetical protein